MRTATIFGILLVLIALLAFGPALIAVGSQEIAEKLFGCEVNLNYAVPCMIGGKDYGQTFYDLGFLIWYSYLSIPAGGCYLASGWLPPSSLSSSAEGRASLDRSKPDTRQNLC